MCAMRNNKYINILYSEIFAETNFIKLEIKFH